MIKTPFIDGQTWDMVWTWTDTGQSLDTSLKLQTLIKWPTWPGAHLGPTWSPPATHLQPNPQKLLTLINKYDIIHWINIGHMLDMDGLWTEFGHLTKTSNPNQVAHLETTWGPPGAHLEPTWGPPGTHLEPTWGPPGAHLEPTGCPPAAQHTETSDPYQLI